MTEPWRDRGARSRLAEHVPLAVVLALVAIGFAQITLYYWRQGTGFIGLALLVAAGLRAVLSEDRLGLLRIRSRSVDLACYGGLSLLILFVALTIEGGPLD